MAHARRYWFKALATDPERARQALALIGALFRLERAHATAPPEQRFAARQREAKPIVEKFFAWCDAEVERVLDETPSAKAIGYARNQRVAFSRFLENGRIPIRRVGYWRGGCRVRGVAVSGRFRVQRRCLIPLRGSVSSARSSNRACGFPAHGICGERWLAVTFQ